MPPDAAQNGDESIPKPHLIFVYGTLKRGFPNHFLMEDLIRSNDAVPLMTSTSTPKTSFSYRTTQPYPLVLGPLGIPYLLNIPGSGRHLRGELYAVSTRGLVRLDELEGLSYGHYERMPIKVVIENKEHDWNGERTKNPQEEHDHNAEKKNQGEQDQKEEKKEKREEAGERGRGSGNNGDGENGTLPVNVIEAEAYYANHSYAEEMWRKSGMVGMEEYTAADSYTYIKPEDRPAGVSFVDRIRAYVASSD